MKIMQILKSVSCAVITLTLFIKCSKNDENMVIEPNVVNVDEPVKVSPIMQSSKNECCFFAVTKGEWWRFGQ